MSVIRSDCQFTTSSSSALAMRRGREARCCKLKINKEIEANRRDAVNYTRFLSLIA